MEDLVNIKGFTALLESTYTFDREKYYSHPGWSVLCNLYNQNFIFANKNVHKIPKKIHQVWLGSPVSDKYTAWRESWKKLNPDWEYKLWTDKDLRESKIHITNWKAFNSITNMGQKSDYLRYHILDQFGGIYADTDYECLKPFDTLLYADFLAGISYDAAPIVNIAILGSVPNHPILKKLISSMVVKPSDKSKDVFNSTGPLFFTKCFFEVVGSYIEGIVVLPPDYFYPFPNQSGFQNRNGRDYIKDCSYGIHYWDVSWIKPKK